MRYLPEPEHRHDDVPGIGVLLVNLGTPEAPTAAALRPYLKQFLSDPRVVEIPRWIWWFILNGIVLNTRPRQSAAKYAMVWTPAGSPLKVYTELQARLLAAQLNQRRCPVRVEWAMRYGAPSVARGMHALRAAGCDRLLVLPMYPQYAASTTASTYDAVFDVLKQTRNAPAVRLIKHFHDYPPYIAALAASVREHWATRGEPDRLIMSFHGLPRFSLDRGDPYHCECQKTGRLLAEALGLDEDRYRVTFQSRFGRAEWLKPYTMETMAELGRAKLRRVDVICPGFTADCLETLEEIALENKRAFLDAGGGEFHYIACLNGRADFIDAVAALVIDNLSGWLPSTAAADDPVRIRERAHALGASR